MALVLNGDGNITGLVAGGLPDGSVTADDIASTLDLSGKTVTLPAGTGGKVLQVVQAVKTTSDSYTLNTTFADITGLSQAITPTNTSSKILITAHVTVGSQNGSTASYPKIRLVRDSTNIGISIDSGSRQKVTAMWWPGSVDANATGVMSMTFLDSPSTTSSTTYKIQVFGSQNRTFYVNRCGSDENTAGGHAISTLTLMEIAG